MLPVARVTYPPDYVLLKHKLTHGTISPEEFDKANQWPELTRLTDKSTLFLKSIEDLSDDDLIHFLDREMGSNRFVSIPTKEDHIPWKKYHTKVILDKDTSFQLPAVDHYYSYWQVHQLHRLQQFSDHYRQKWLISLIPQEDKQKYGYDRPINTQPFVTFLGRSRLFDALSFWIVVYDRESDRTFAGIPKRDGVKTLSSAQENDYEKRLQNDAKVVTERFQLQADDLYSFLHELLKLMEDYRRDERFKLLGDLKRDIFSLAGFIECVTGSNFDEIAKDLGQRSNHGQTFRHLHIPTKERDEAISFAQHVLQNADVRLSTRAGTSWSSRADDAGEILDHCAVNGLDLLVTALSGMTAVGDEEYRQKFRRVQRYSNLKNILTSYEYFLKSVSDKGGYAIGGKPLTPAVEQVMRNEAWIGDFQIRARKGLLSAKGSDEFLDNLEALNQDVHLKSSVNGLWAYVFLVTCLGRNMTVHAYPSQHRYYGQLFGNMLDAVVMAICYTWDLARSEGWL